MKDLIKLSASLLLILATPITSSATVAQTQNLTIEGSVDGYNTRNFDNKLDFGLVIPTLSKKQVMDFSLSSVLSTETDVIRAAGQSIRVPSNLSLPRQSERYFITIRINKPKFRLPIHSAELPKTVAVLEGHMPFESTVDALRGGSPLFSVINSFTFKSFTLAPITDLEEEVQITAGENTIEGDETEFALPLETDKDYVSLGLNLNSTFSEEGETTYFPIGIKTLERPQNLKTLGETTTPAIVTVLKSTFESTGEESKDKPFPFSLVWGESKPEVTLPLGKDFIEVTEGENLSFNIDNSKLTDFKVIAYKVTTYDNELNIITEDTFKELDGGELIADVEIKRLRVDVLAIDPDPILTSIMNDPVTDDEIFEQAKYITRYEKDLN